MNPLPFVGLGIGLAIPFTVTAIAGAALASRVIREIRHQARFVDDLTGPEEPS